MIKKATQWSRYDTMKHEYFPVNVEMRHVPESHVRPYSDSEHMNAMWSSMAWKKTYGYYDTETQEFYPSKLLNQ